MASNSGSNPPYAPSAPPAPGPDQPRVAYPYQPPPNPSSPYAPVTHTSHTHSSPTPPPPNPSSPYAPVTHTGHYQHSSSASYGPGPAPQGYGYNPYQHQPQQHNIYNSFPPGTHPDVIRSFQMVDRNQNGYIEETELGEALTWNYQKFSRRTLRFLIFLFRNPRESSRIGPKEFSEIWSCLGQWRGIFERFDRDRSGKIDSVELRDALYSLGYAVPPPVLQVLISRYEDGSGRRVELTFDSFVECGMIIKGLTEKFKEKDPRYTGSATLSYDTFMSMIIPFLVSE